MSFDFDEGAGGGSEGPWVQWSARGTMDGEIPPRSFFLRSQDGKEVMAAFDRGVVLDIQNMKTGWCHSSGAAGVPPEWKWNASISTFAPKPGDDFKKGFSIRCGISKTDAATWEQSGAAAWNAFVGLVPAIRAASAETAAGKLPVVKMTGVKTEKFARGSTTWPVLEIVKWVARPDSLKSGVAGIDTGDSDDEPVKPAKVAPKAEPLPADADEF